MTVQEISQDPSSIDIPCLINRASLGTADNVFVLLHKLLEPAQKVAWVPRKDLVVERQPVEGDQLNATLTVHIEREEPNGYVVTIYNNGLPELITVPKGA
jgi:hypothetical protein